jgi:hypothetical protein
VIIGLCGLAGVGKSTAGRILRDEYGFVPIAFADSLKDGVAALFGWERRLLEGDTIESRTFRETEDPYWTKAFGKPITPRYVLQHVGTDLFRNWLGSFWVSSAGYKMRDTTKNYVVTDVRFFNEMDMIRYLKGYNVNIRTGMTEAPWVTKVEEEMMRDRQRNMGTLKGPLAEVFENLGVHRSEWEHIYYRHHCDYILYNQFTEAEDPTSLASLSGSISHMIRLFTGPKDVKTQKNKALDTTF